MLLNLTTDQVRQIIVSRAVAKYIDSGKTRNITEALALYLKNDAGPDEQIPLFITSPEIHRVQEVLKHIRPRCDDCNTELYLKVGTRDPNGKTYPTAWTCKNCGIEHYSELTPAEWLKELRLETRKQNLRDADKLDRTNLPVGRQEPEI